MAMNTSRSMSGELTLGMLEGGRQTGNPDRSPTDLGHAARLRELHNEQYGGLPGGSAVDMTRSIDEREVIPTQLPVTYVGVQP